jgi:proline dehydrogenase
MGCSRALAEELLGRATQAGVGVHFDAMRPESAAATFELIRRLAARHSGIGCTLPARWQRSAHDAELALEHGLKVRVVKGQWGDPAGDPAQHPDQLRARYLSLVDRLAGRARHVGVATHDVALAREALRRLRAAGTSCQLELLFGLPLRASLRVAAEAGVSTRLYVPYGSAWIPYCLSRLRENPGVLLWLMRDAFFCRLGKIPLTR